MMQLGLFFAIFSAIIYSFTAVLNRDLKEVHSAIVVFYIALGGLISHGIYIIIEAAVTGEGLRIV